jgi:hypothetical protein
VRDADGDKNGWHDNQSVVWAAGVAAVILLGALIFAVVEMSGGSTDPPGPRAPLPSYATTSGSRTSTSSTTSTSYPVPSVQTTELLPGAPTAPIATTDQPTDQVTDLDTPSPTTSTTIFNPYVTTTQPAAGHV